METTTCILTRIGSQYIGISTFDIDSMAMSIKNAKTGVIKKHNSGESVLILDLNDLYSSSADDNSSTDLDTRCIVFCKTNTNTIGLVVDQIYSVFDPDVEGTVRVSEDENGLVDYVVDVDGGTVVVLNIEQLSKLVSNHQ